MTKPSCPFQEHLVFTVCLSYQYSGLEDTIEEKQEVNVGKPLIAKLDIHRGLGRKTCFQTCLMCNGPYQSSASTAAGAGAGQYHSSPDSFLGVYHSHLGSSGDVMPPDSCHCSRTADALLSSHHTHHYSCRFGRSNVPVETTEELPFTFSDGLRIAEKWPPRFWKVTIMTRCLINNSTYVKWDTVKEEVRVFRERELVPAISWLTRDFGILEFCYLVTEFLFFLFEDVANWLICSVEVTYGCVYVYLYKISKCKVIPSFLHCVLSLVKLHFELERWVSWVFLHKSC